MTSPPSPIVVAEGVSASYGVGRLRTAVLRDVSLTVQRGSVTAIMGPSGSGKSTLLGLIGGLDQAEAGRLEVDGVELRTLSRGDLSRYRRERVGFVFQAFHLLAGLTAEENVLAGLEPLRLPRAEARRRALAALDATGVGALAARFPGELSGGEQQRVAVARAVAKRPALVLADEPTGSLDAEAGRRVLDLLVGRDGVARRALGAAEEGRAPTVILVTHDAEIAARADRVLRLADQRLLAPATA